MIKTNIPKSTQIHEWQGRTYVRPFEDIDLERIRNIEDEIEAAYNEYLEYRDDLRVLDTIPGGEGEVERIQRLIDNIEYIRSNPYMITLCNCTTLISYQNQIVGFNLIQPCCEIPREFPNYEDMCKINYFYEGRK